MNILIVKYVGKKENLIAKNLNANNVNFIITYSALNANKLKVYNELYFTMMIANKLKVYNALYFTMMIEILLLDLKMV